MDRAVEGFFDSQGSLVGITTFYLKEGQSLNFALPGEWVNAVLTDFDTAGHQSDVELESKAWLQIGLEAVKKKEGYDLGQNSFQKCADLKQSDAYRAWVELGKIWGKDIGNWYATRQLPAPAQEMLTKTIAAFERAIELKPDYADAWMELAEVYRLRREFEQGISAAKEATRLSPGDWNTWFRLGGLYLNKKSYQEAIDALQRAQKLAPKDDPEMPVMLILVGKAFAEQGDRESVLRIYKEIQTRYPSYAETFFREFVLPLSEDHVSKQRSKQDRQ